MGNDIPSDMLAAQIVVYRLIGINRDKAVEAMQELSRREAEGDDFDYKSFIEERIALAPERPKGNKTGLTQLGDLLKTFAGGTNG
jgi:hypothetical protein